MARIRTIKPEFWQDEDLAFLDAETRLLAIGLLNHADDEGYFKAHPALIKAVVFPFTDNSLSLQGMLTELSNVGYLRLFEGSDGKQYGEIIGFTKHQKVNRPSPSKIKPLDGITEDSVNAHGDLTTGKEQGTGKGKDIKSEEKKSKDQLDFSSWPEMPSDQMLKDWKQLRRTKKAPISQTVINTFGKELTKAKELGFSVDDCFERIIIKSWQGFEASWMTKAGSTAPTPQQPAPSRKTMPKPGDL